MADSDIALFSSRKRLKTLKTNKTQQCPEQPTVASAVEEPDAQPTYPTEPSITTSPPLDTTTFKALGLSEWLQKVCSSLGMSKPTPVQQACVPAILQGRDVIGVAHTGSGKTAAFALPILQKLSKDPYGVFALVLTPTRELAFQLAEQFQALGAGLTLKHSVVVGGLDMQQQSKELARRPHVVIATPGRLKVRGGLESIHIVWSA